MQQLERYELYLESQWQPGDGYFEVINPYSDAVCAEVASASSEAVKRSVVHADKVYRETDFPAWQRADVLERTAQLVAENETDLTSTIAAESGKPLKQARAEVMRGVQTLRFSALEARKLAGEVVPMQASEAGVGKLGFILRVPLGAVAAVTPFNFPLNLVCHKLGPAVAAGNTVVLKPASATPVSAIKLVQLFLAAGLPPGWISVVCGSGATVGAALTEHELIKLVSFTGSSEVGWQLKQRLPRKRVCLELGSNAPLIVEADGDWQTAADKAAVHGFSHAGQSCISTQRILVHEEIKDAFTERLLKGVANLKVGNPMLEETDVGPLIDRHNRDRVLQWIEQAVSVGGKLLTGGSLNPEGLLLPTIIADASFESAVWREEVFGPLVTLNSYSEFSEAIGLANDSDLGLQCGVFTSDIAKALRGTRELDFGGVLINEVPTFRADQQPYGGVKDSGNTREGPAYAIREQTEERFVTLQ